MSIELTIAQRDTLDFLWLVYELDIVGKQPAQFCGGLCAVNPANDLIGIGFAMRNPENEAYTCITQAGADYLGKGVMIMMPFVKPDELTAARAEIARLNDLLSRCHEARVFSNGVADTAIASDTAKDAEIARLTAALAASEAARKVADAGWSECIDVCDELRKEITLLKTDSGIPY